jgi:hypothetical protein
MLVARLRATQRVAVVACLALAVCGCSGGGKGPAVPDGHERFDKHGFSFVYPSGWKATEEADPAGKGRLLFVTGPDSPARVPPQVAVSWRDVAADISEFDARLLLDKAKIGVAHPGLKVSVDEAVQVPGAKNAHRMDTTYPVKDMTGADRTIKSVQLFLESDDHLMVGVDVRAPAEQFDSYGLADVVSSFRLS